MPIAAPIEIFTSGLSTLYFSFQYYKIQKNNLSLRHLLAVVLVRHQGPDTDS